jgi:hypothetical protein
MGAAHFIEILEADDGRDVANHHMGTPHSGNQVMA